MSYKRKQLPKYCLHKGSGQAYCRIAGDTHYLGKHGSDASRREYDRIMGEFIANGRQPFRHPDEITVSQLIIRYLDHVETELSLSESRNPLCPFAPIYTSCCKQNNLYCGIIFPV